MASLQSLETSIPLTEISDLLRWDSKHLNDVVHRISTKIALWQGDISKLKIDAIVNSANSTLIGGGNF